MKKIALVGSTGSIGKQTISVVCAFPQLFKIVALVAHTSTGELTKQAQKLKPDFVALTDGNAAKKMGELPSETRLLCGDHAGLTAIEECGADLVVVACGGFTGLQYAMKAAELNLPLALANKESLVCGGELLMPRIKTIMPVDSEHSAIWQCLGFNLKAPYKRLIITASGGAFRGRRWEDLSEVTAAEALAHPTWKMGEKITVDSATLLNKGFEVIEAHHLFSAPYEKITTVIHPQSIVHSMVEFEDGSIAAQASYPNMELPIQLALTYPERLASKHTQIDFTKGGNLEFLPLVRKDYPMYDFALTCGEEGGILPTALNAASEVAVRAFLAGKLKYTAMYTVVKKVVEATKNMPVESLFQLFEVDVKSRVSAANAINEVK